MYVCIKRIPMREEMRKSVGSDNVPQSRLWIHTYVGRYRIYGKSRILVAFHFCRHQCWNGKGANLPMADAPPNWSPFSCEGPPLEAEWPPLEAGDGTWAQKYSTNVTILYDASFCRSGSNTYVCVWVLPLSWNVSRPSSLDNGHIYCRSYFILDDCTSCTDYTRL